MNAQICRCCSSFNDATYSETEATPMLHLHGSQITIKLTNKRRKTAILDGFSDKVGPSGETRTPGILLPKQARYQLRYTRLWNCFICGLSCGLGRFLTNNFVELVPASGSVPAGCGLRLFPSWMRPACSQSKRATNCATPGFLRLPSTVCQGREPTAYQDRLLLYWTHSV